MKSSAKITWKRVVATAIVVVVAGFLLIQLVPYGRDHANPPVVGEPAWDSPQTRAIAKEACFDCHSNETTWPWYASVAPVSWLTQHDVEEGRQYLNFSEWGTRGEGEEAEELVEVLRADVMPPSAYRLMHPQAQLTNSQMEELIQGLSATVQ